MATFRHKDIEIECDSTRGDFYAVVGGKVVRKPSLKAMKTHIDTVDATVFKPFVAMDIYGNKFQVTGIEQKRRGRFNVAKWNTTHGRQGDVIEDTPENRRKVLAYRKRKAEVENLTDKMDAELEALSEAIVRLVPPQ